MDFNKLTIDLFTIIVNNLKFKELLIIFNTNKSTNKIIRNNMNFLKKKEIFAANLIKYYWLESKLKGNKKMKEWIRNRQICTAIQGLKDPDFNCSMKNWIFVYDIYDNLCFNKSLEELFGSDKYVSQACVIIHPFTIKQYPFIKTESEKRGLSSEIILDRNELEFHINSRNLYYKED